MNVQLLSCTPNAIDLLLFTKNTRLTMSPNGLAEVAAWSEEKKAEELRYMRNTIQSSWEFVDYMFAITGVTRAFTHQLVRHRVGTSFAQQAQRVVNMEGFNYLATGSDLACGADSATRASTDRSPVDNDGNPANIYDWTMRVIDGSYGKMLSMGVKAQDARGVLPTNILTNIIFKANLRTLHDMALKRLCVKAQGEFQDVFKLLVDRVVEVHPWASDFLRVQCAWNGTCLFPSLPVEDCHVKPYVYDPQTAMSYGQSSGLHSPFEAQLYTTEEIYQLHRSKRTEIQPTVPTVTISIDPAELGEPPAMIREKDAAQFLSEISGNHPIIGHVESATLQMEGGGTIELGAGELSIDREPFRNRPSFLGFPKGLPTESGEVEAPAFVETCDAPTPEHGGLLCTLPKDHPEEYHQCKPYEWPLSSHEQFQRAQAAGTTVGHEWGKQHE